MPLVSCKTHRAAQFALDGLQRFQDLVRIPQHPRAAASAPVATVGCWRWYCRSILVLFLSWLERRPSRSRQRLRKVLSQLVHLNLKLLRLRGSSSGTPRLIWMQQTGALSNRVKVVRTAPLESEVVTSSCSRYGTSRWTLGGFPDTRLSRLLQPVPYSSIVQKCLLQVHHAFAQESGFWLRDQVPKSDVQCSFGEFVSCYSHEAQVRVPDGILASRGYLSLNKVLLVAGCMKGNGLNGCYGCMWNEENNFYVTQIGQY